MPFTTTVRDKLEREALASLALLCGPDFTEGNAVTELGHVATMRVIGSVVAGTRGGTQAPKARREWSL